MSIKVAEMSLISLGKKCIREVITLWRNIAILFPLIKVEVQRK